MQIAKPTDDFEAQDKTRLLWEETTRAKERAQKTGKPSKISFIIDRHAKITRIEKTEEIK